MQTLNKEVATKRCEKKHRPTKMMRKPSHQNPSMGQKRPRVKPNPRLKPNLQTNRNKPILQHTNNHPAPQIQQKDTTFEAEIEFQPLPFVSPS